MNIHAIINGISRRRVQNSIREKLTRRLSGHRLTIQTTAHAGHATELTRRAVIDGAEVVVAVGGDGTVNEVLNGIIGTETKLAVIPAGSANDLASYFGLSSDPDRACDTILTGHVTTIDTVRVNDWHYATTGGLGLPSEIIERVNVLRSRSRLGRWLANLGRSHTYVWALANALGQRKQYGHVSVEIGGVRLEADPLSLTLSNLPRLGRHFCPAPEARPDNSRLDLCLIENRGRLQALLISIKVVRGRHQARPEVRQIKIVQATITSTQPLQFFGDGELRPAAKRFDIELQPRSLPLLTPESGEVS